MLNTFIKSRVIQIIIHVSAWSFLIFMPALLFEDNFNMHKLTESIVRYCIFITFFYTNAYLLIPKILTKHNYLYYILSLIISFILLLMLNIVSDILLHQGRFFRNEAFIYHTIIRTFFFTLFIFGLSTSFKSTSEWLKSERQKKEMENEKLLSELAFLKSQINPHFLFNTLNNIYSLAYKKSDDTPTVIVKLSQLMRYMLYESSSARVPLSKEIDYLNNYIDLQKIRLGENISVSFHVKGNIDRIYIEPLLFVPFVENAFKHGVSNTEQAEIEFNLEIDELCLVFFAKNKIFETSSKQKDSGIGLNNVKRRLDLLYPDKHTLTNHVKENSYIVELTINTEK